MSSQHMHQATALSLPGLHRVLLVMYYSWNSICLGIYFLSLKNAIFFLEMLNYHQINFLGALPQFNFLESSNNVPWRK